MQQSMFTYIKSQDQNFMQKPFTNADAVVLSTVANIDLSYFYYKNGQEKISLGKLAEDFVNFCPEQDQSNEKNLLKLISESKRYKDIQVSHVVSILEKGDEKQFGALVFYPTPQKAYIGFAGTGTSVIGYKEDLNMAFMDMIPSQQESVRYINEVAKEIPNDVELMVGGFSKGGNLAVFASAFANPRVRERIRRVYNHDGPGFSEIVLKEKKYKTILPLVRTYIPQASIVGLMLDHNNDYNIIESTAPPIAQHQPYSWLFDTETDDLLIRKDLSKTSNFILKFQENLLKSMDVEKRRDSINAIFDIISWIEPDDFLKMAEMGREIFPAMRNAWKEADGSTKKNIGYLAKVTGKSFIKSIELPKKKKKKNKNKSNKKKKKDKHKKKK